MTKVNYSYNTMITIDETLNFYKDGKGNFVLAQESDAYDIFSWGTPYQEDNDIAYSIGGTYTENLKDILDDMRLVMEEETSQADKRAFLIEHSYLSEEDLKHEDIDFEYEDYLVDCIVNLSEVSKVFGKTLEAQGYHLINVRYREHNYYRVSNYYSITLSNELEEDFIILNTNNGGWTSKQVREPAFEKSLVNTFDGYWNGYSMDFIKAPMNDPKAIKEVIDGTIRDFDTMIGEDNVSEYIKGLKEVTPEEATYLASLAKQVKEA